MISFKSLSGQSKLFLDFLYDFQKVSRFYRGDFRNPQDVKRRIDELASFPRRDALADALLQQHAEAGELTRRQVGLLRNPTTVAVVTGQQMGLFLGPLFTLYKAIGTLRYCRQLKEQYPGHDFVPVFWLELEDHDFDEVRSVTLVNLTNELKTVAYEGNGNDGKQPIYRIPLTADIGRVRSELREILYKTDFSPQWESLLDQYCAEGTSLSESFKRLLMTLLGAHGLVTLDPSDPKLKSMARPVFEQELTQPEKTLTALQTQSANLRAAGYELQVEPDSTNLFLLETSGARHPLNRTGAIKFKLRADELAAYRRELLVTLGQESHRFIPNVVLRPIVQDYLLPTLAYLAGPSEIAYLAQFHGVYETFGVAAPLIVPRPFATIVERKIAKAVEKFGLTAEEVLSRGSDVLAVVAERSGGLRPSVLVQEERGQILAALQSLQKKLAEFDSGLGGAAKTSADKIEQALKVLEAKATDAEKRLQEQQFSQLAKALTHLRPGGSLQERTLNVLYYLNKYGLAFVDRLVERLEPTAIGHQLIYPD